MMKNVQLKYLWLGRINKRFHSAEWPFLACQLPNIYKNNKRKCNLQLLEACQSRKHHLREFNDVIVLKKPDDAQIV